MERRNQYIIIVAAILIIGAICAGLFAKSPVVSVSGAEISSLNLSAIGLAVTLTVDSPYPITVPVKKLDYSIAYIGKETPVLLSDGVEQDIVMKPGSQEMVIPVVISNPALISSLWEVLKSGEIGISVSGNVTPDFLGIAPSVPFRKDITAHITGKDILSGLGSLVGSVLGK